MSPPTVVVVVSGPQGSGKTTLLREIAEFLKQHGYQNEHYGEIDSHTLTMHYPHSPRY